MKTKVNKFYKTSFALLLALCFCNTLFSQDYFDESKKILKSFEKSIPEDVLFKNKFNGQKINNNVTYIKDDVFVLNKIQEHFTQDSCKLSGTTDTTKAKFAVKHKLEKTYSKDKNIHLTIYKTVNCNSYTYCLIIISSKEGGLMYVAKRDLRNNSMIYKIESYSI
jgi:hypothetical protein